MIAPVATVIAVVTKPAGDVIPFKTLAKIFAAELADCAPVLKTPIPVVTTLIPFPTVPKVEPNADKIFIAGPIAATNKAVFITFSFSSSVKSLKSSTKS